MNNLQTLGRQFQEEGIVILSKIFDAVNLGNLEQTLHGALCDNDQSMVQVPLHELIALREHQDHGRVYRASKALGSSAWAYRLIGGSDLIRMVSEISSIRCENLHLMPLVIQVQIPGETRFDYKWHQESTYYPWADDVLSVWFPIGSPSRVSNGTMSVVPGSHKQGVIDYKRWYSYENFRQLESSVSEVTISGARPVEIDVGDCALFDSNLVHCSLPNTGDVARLTGIIRMIDMSTQSTHRCLYTQAGFDVEMGAIQEAG